MFEYEIAALFDSEFKRNNSTYAYTPIVAGGANACVLHYIENNEALEDGDLLLIDAGCETEGYASDITRTFPVNGRFSEAQKQIYNIVLDAQKGAINCLKPGEKVNKAHDTACHIISNGLTELGDEPYTSRTEHLPRLKQCRTTCRVRRGEVLEKHLVRDAQRSTYLLEDRLRERVERSVRSVRICSRDFLPISQAYHCTGFELDLLIAHAVITLCGHAGHPVRHIPHL
jgi:methionine aminopeptidase